MSNISSQRVVWPESEGCRYVVIDYHHAVGGPGVSILYQEEVEGAADSWGTIDSMSFETDLADDIATAILSITSEKRIYE